MILATVMPFGRVSLASFVIDAAPYHVWNLDGRLILLMAEHSAQVGNAAGSADD